MEPEARGAVIPERWDSRWLEIRREVELKRTRHGPDGGSRRRLGQPLHYRFLKWGLKGTGLYRRGYRNFLDIRLVRQAHHLPDWPPELDGFRILQVSDLHIDLDPGILPVVLERLAGLEYDMAVFTGDFWEGHTAEIKPTLNGMRAILKTVGRPSHGVYGVLGNHDLLRIGVWMEEMGIHILANDAVVVEHDNARFALAGVDDAYFFRTHDVRAAARHCPDNLPRLLLSHSPQVAASAEEAGFSLMLSGHTHGGQICGPGGRPLMPMKEIPLSLFRGPWRTGGLTGYTSTGTGACHVPVRFNCPPEIVVHTIHRLSG